MATVELKEFPFSRSVAPRRRPSRVDSHIRVISQARAPGATAVDAAVHLAGVRKSFGPVRAVDGIDLQIREGEIAALLGPNGAGKTTTIDMILGLSRPDQGSVSVFGMSPTAAVGRGLIAAVLQTGGLLKDLTVGETLRLTATLFADPRPVDEVMRRAGVEDIAGRLVGKCSGGQFSATQGGRARLAAFRAHADCAGAGRRP